jgi:hypothetical protein
MTLPESFDRNAVLDATLTDMLAVRGLTFRTLPPDRKFALRDNLLPVLNAMAPHIHAQLQATEHASVTGAFIVPDTLEGLLP